MKSALAIEGGLLKKILALALVASLYLMFILPTAGAASPYQVSGQLVSTGNVVVNSAEVPNGGTILPGSRITVKAPVQATINLGSLGKVDALTNSDFTLDFTANSVTVTLNYGTVTLTTQSGIAGEVKTPGSVRVQVAQGNVSVKTDDKTDSLGGGKQERVAKPADITSNGPSTFTVSGSGAGPTNGPVTTGGTAGAGGAGASSLPNALTIAIIGGSIAAAVGAGIALGGRPNNVSPA